MQGSFAGMGKKQKQQQVIQSSGTTSEILNSLSRPGFPARSWFSPLSKASSSMLCQLSQLPLLKPRQYAQQYHFKILVSKQRSGELKEHVSQIFQDALRVGNH